ncbi:phosphoglucosamine mutase [Georgenia sp. 311]|uniref:Phosphoglucosamine mutase n=1 Tax=Georgenia wutianyii TaxID=2585135 RepID=A0ABX5VRU0_9MICO|nr:MULTISPECIES: phosphoglucosamine mutase [Georgenia]QDB80198.1 phosphoglucosamine mutase [Georgenia wutianyii]TNC20645.1 phosphoglucosamine mutase [Georgenia sp. 311]
MPRLFGTDGVRGLANRDISAELALGLGAAAARVLTASTEGSGRRPRAVIGRDTRISGDFLSAAIAAGLTSAGVDVVQVGVLPTPGVAHLTATTDVDLGVVISASHNPMPDNGIKFFARGGFKLEDAIEDAIEESLGTDWARPTGDGVGRIEEDARSADRTYIDHLVAATGRPLEGLRIAIDCANGAASDIAPLALREAGADVVVINASPDGRNINDDCGSTHPEQLQAVTVASGAAMGVAFDGDADRCIAVDHAGTIVDGDQIMGVLATALKERGQLAEDTLVVTVMSNLGLLLAMREAGIRTVQTGVGDRYVLEAMRAGGFNLGGEQSGHVIASDHATTGDGLLTALLLAARVVESGRPLADLASIVTRLPQTLLNVGGVDKARAGQDAVLQEAVAAAETRLGDTGRVLLRPSGTESLVRVMVEAATQEEADLVAGELAEVVRARLSLG